MVVSLGDEHVGYRRMDLPMLNLSIVGGRPFSCGGRPLFRKQLLKARFVVLFLFVSYFLFNAHRLFIITLSIIDECCLARVSKHV